MKNIVMTGRYEYIVVDWREMAETFDTHVSVESFWKRHAQDERNKFIYVPKNLWAKRTYAIISISPDEEKAKFLKGISNTVQWVVNGKVTRRSNMLKYAKGFRGSAGIFVEHGGKFFLVSSGDAEALLLGYTELSVVERKLVSDEPYNYLKI